MLVLATICSADMHRTSETIYTLNSESETEFLSKSVVYKTKIVNERG